MRHKNKFHRDDFPFVLVFIGFCLVVFFVVSEYISVASTCNGVVVKDYMGLPACVENPNVTVPVR